MRNGIVISESPALLPRSGTEIQGDTERRRLGGEGVRGKRKGKEEYEAEGRSGVERGGGSSRWRGGGRRRCERERERGKGGRGSTVNSPIQCSYHLPLSLTTHRRHLRIVPPTLQVRLADVPCLTGKLNRYFTVSYPLRSLPSPRPFLSRAATLSLSPSSFGGRSSCPAAEQARGRAVVARRTDREEERHLPSLQSHFRGAAAAAAAAAAWGSAGARRAAACGNSVCELQISICILYYTSR